MAEQTPFILGTMRLGAWGARFSTPQYIDFLENCAAAGIDTLDTADIYGDHSNLNDLGKVFRERPDLRDHFKIIFKFGIRRVCPARPENRVKSYDSSPEYIHKSVKMALEELGVNHLQMAMIHRPDELMNPAESAAAFFALQKEELISKVGVSNFSLEQFREFSYHLELSAHQVEASLLHQDLFENGLIRDNRSNGVEIQAWSPLAGGELFNENSPPQLLQELDFQCKKHDCGRDQIAFAWLLRHPANIRPVLGTTRISRVKSALAAQRIELTGEDWYALKQAATGKRLP